jgi:hypothetical protein
VYADGPYQQPYPQNTTSTIVLSLTNVGVTGTCVNYDPWSQFERRITASSWRDFQRERRTSEVIAEFAAMAHKWRRAECNSPPPVPVALASEATVIWSRAMELRARGVAWLARVQGQSRERRARRRPPRVWERAAA